MIKDNNLAVLLDALAETISSLKLDIYIRDMRVEELEKKLDEAKKGREEDGNSL